MTNQAARILSRISAILVVTNFGLTANAQWSFTVLNPGNANASYAYAGNGGHQVGAIVTGTGYTHAGYWTGTSDSFIDLDPNGTYFSYANAISGDQQGGQVTASAFSGHAYLWTGSPASAIDLHPAGYTSSAVLAMNNSIQGGFVATGPSTSNEHAAIWSGSASSFIDMHPTSSPAGYIASRIMAMSESQQGGYGLTSNGYRQALLWNGSANNTMSLHGATTTTFSASAVYAMTATQQGGVANYYSGGGTANEHAIIWSGSYYSRVDLQPNGASSSRVLAMVGDFQAGQVNNQAAVWRETASSYETLHPEVTATLGTNYTVSTITGAYIDNNILYLVGSATDTVNHIIKAVMWSRPITSVIPAILTQPIGQLVNIGDAVTFFVQATAYPSPTYQWFHNGTPIAGTNKPALILSSAQVADAGDYAVSITNTEGTATSSNATLLVINEVPIITKQPLPQSAAAGSTAKFTIEAKATAPFIYRWQAVAPGSSTWVDLTDDTTYNGTSTATLNVSAAPGIDGYIYRCLVSNSAGNAASSGAQLSVLITSRIRNVGPTLEVVTPGQSVSLSVEANIATALTYQWYHNGKSISGATTSTLNLNTAVFSDSGYYFVDASDDEGSDRSKPFWIHVAPTRTQIRGWGWSSARALNIPENITNTVTIEACSDQGLATLADGTVTAWGNLAPGMPSGLSNIVMVKGSPDHVLALKSDGTVVGWGFNSYGQISTPIDLGNVVAVAASLNRSLALKSNGTVVGWGYTGGQGQLTVPAGLSNVIAIAAGDYFSLALKGDGTVVAWGDNNKGQTPVPAALADVTAISANSDYALALKSDGTVMAWGADTIGQTDVPAGLAGVVAISAGNQHALALKSDGTIVGWGNGANGELTPPADLSNVFAIAGGQAVTLALCDATSDTAPVIDTAPAGQTALEGQSLTLSVMVTGPGPLTYQWRKDSTNIAGATGATLTFSQVLPADAGSYDVVVTNHIGSTISPVATLAVRPLPVITGLQTAKRLVLTPGQALQLGLTATGTGPLLYQWIHNGRDIAGATNASYVISQTGQSDDGWYAVDVSDDNGTRRSAAIFVIIAPAATELIGWGANGSNQLNIPSSLDSITVAAGGSHVLSLQRDGTVAAWGNNSANQTSVPAGLDHVVAVAAGFRHSLALKDDGTVVAWGFGYTFPPANLKQVVAIAASGEDNSIALKSDGNVVAWGRTNTVPAGLSHVVSIAAGRDFLVAIKDDGTMVEWRQNTSLTVPNGLNQVVAATAGYYHSVALKVDGTVTAWGSDSYGYNTTVVPANLAGVRQVSAGAYHTLALRQDGTVVAWGSNSDGQSSPPGNLNHCFDVAAGDVFSLVLRDVSGDPAPVLTTQPASQTVYASASATFSVTAASNAPATYQWYHDGSPISGANQSTYTIAASQAGDAGSYTVTVTNIAGSATSNGATLTVNPSTAPVITQQPVDQPALAGGSVTFAVTATGIPTPTYQWQVLRFGDDTWYNTGDGSSYSGSTTASLTLSDLLAGNSGDRFRCVVSNVAGAVTSDAVTLTVGAAGFVKLSAGRYHSLQLSLAGQLYATGTNTYGQLGNGTTSNATSPQLITIPGQTVTDIAAGGQHSLFLTASHDLWAVGFNGNDQLGDGTTTSRSTPYKLADDVVAMAAGYFHSAFIKSDGSLWICGGNDSGQLGNGTTTDAATPIQIATDVSDVALGIRQTFFLKADGTLWGAGDMYNNGTTVSTPIQIATHVTAIAAGGYHSLFLKDDGSLWTLGYNGYGQLGNASTTTSTTPVQVTTGVQSIAAGYFHSAFIKTDHTLWVMGRNDSGSLGDVSAVNRLAPFQLDTNVEAVSASESYTLYIKLDGSLWGIGYNAYGQFGNGTTTVTSTPVQITTGAVLAPNAPSDFVATAAAPFDRVFLTWSAQAAAASYEVWRSTTNDSTTATRIAALRWPFFEDLNVTSGQTYFYWLKAVNASGTSTFSEGVSCLLSLGSAPTITIQPISQTTTAGTDVTFNVGADGTGTLNYQWSHDGVAISGANDTTFTLPAVLGTDSGNYAVTVSNQAGSVISAPATLLVQGPPAVIKVAAGSFHTLFLRDDGTLWAAGNNASGQLGDGTTTNRSLPVQVASNVTAMAAGFNHSMFIKSDGTLWGMGTNYDGQLGLGTIQNQATPVQVATGVAQVVAWGSTTYFIRNDRTLWAMGRNYSGQMGLGQTAVNQDFLSPTLLAEDVAFVAVGSAHSLIIKTDHTLWAAGSNAYGQLGDGTVIDKAEYVKIAAGVVQAAAGSNHSLFLTQEGTVSAMGDNAYGQLGDGSTLNRYTPTQVATGIVRVIAGENTSYLIKSDGAAWQTGARRDGTTDRDATPVERFNGVLSLAISSNNDVVALADGRVRTAGTNYYGQLANGQTAAQASQWWPLQTVYAGTFTLPADPIAATASTGTDIGAIRLTWDAVLGAASYDIWRGSTADPASAVSIAMNVSLPLFTDTSATWGQTYYYWVLPANPAGTGNFGTPVTGAALAGTAPVITVQPQSMTAYPGSSVTLSVTFEGSEPLSFQWQKDNVDITGATQPALTLTNLQISDSGSYRIVITNTGGSVTSAAAALDVTVPQGALQVGAGNVHSLFLRSDGGLWGMGSSINGQLGNNTPTYTSPVLVANNVVGFAAGGFFTLFVKTDGTLWAMGANNSGQLGDGSTTVRYTPVLIDTNVAAVAAGAEHSLYIKKDGSLWATGSGAWGQLGRGLPGDVSAPVKVADDAIAIAAGDRHSLMLKSDGSLWATGDGTNGALGNGDYSSTTTWVQVDTNVVKIAASSFHTLYVKSDGTLWATGNNASGQLGAGSTDNYATPVHVANTVSGVAAGSLGSRFFMTDGTLFAMGSNGGSYGNGSTPTSNRPQLVNPGPVSSLALGSSYMLFTLSDGSLWAAGNNYYGQLGNGTTTDALTSIQVVTGTLVVPAAPTQLSATDEAFGDGVRLSWTAPVGWQRFVVWRNTVDSSASATQLAAQVGLPYYHDTTAIPGTTYYYWVEAANPAGVSPFSASDAGSDAIAVLPVITTQPVEQVVNIHSDANASFSVVANGTEPVSYQWRNNGINLVNSNYVAGATTANLTLHDLLASDAGAIDVVITNPAGSVTSEAASLTVGYPPSIYQQPADTSAFIGTMASFTVVPVTDALLPNPTYQWSHDGVEIDGATSVTLTISNVQLGDQGSYTVTVANPFGSETSNPATLTANQQSQTITFATPADISFTTDSITLSATTDSGLTVTFSIVSGPATLNGDQLTLNGPGSITVEATQAGNATYAAATPVQRAFTVTGNLASWSLGNFNTAELADSSISGPDADPDHDGLSNLLEYALGLDPKHTDTIGLPEMSTTASDWVYTFTRPADRPDLTYSVEVSSDLVTWSSSGVSLIMTGASGDTQTWQASYPTGSTDKVFFRLKITN